MVYVKSFLCVFVFVVISIRTGRVNSMPVVMMMTLLILTVSADLMTDRIPNALTLTGLAAGLLQALVQAGAPGLLSSAAAAAAMFFFCYLLFVIKAMRGGDGKLMSALAAMTGFAAGWKILLISFLIALMIGFPAAAAKHFKGRTHIHFSVPVLLAALIMMM